MNYNYKKKKKMAWHITTATHNSRHSQRMFDNHVKLGKPVWLSDKEELIVTETIAEIVEKDKLNIIAYNICGDHMHILLVCEEKEVPKIVGKIKAMSARACNIEMGRTIPGTTATRGNAPLSYQGEAHPGEAHPDEATAPDSDSSTSKAVKRRGETQSKLWTQKFNKSRIDNKEYMDNAIEYIRNNRIKHKLHQNQEINRIIEKMCCSVEHAFCTEYDVEGDAAV